MRNWAGNLEFTSSALAEPDSVEDLLDLTATVPHLQAIGTRHSFSGVADTEGLHVSTVRLPIGIDIDSSARSVRVPAHARYGDIAMAIHAQGWALANLASLPHISVAGSVATGTHGSGDANGPLASSVRSLTMAASDGSLIRLARGEADFDGAVTSLGCLGIVTELELDIEPTYEVRQDLVNEVSRAAVSASFDEVFASAYSVSMFTTWQADGRAQLWLKQREAADVESVAALVRGMRAEGKHNPVPGEDPAHSTEQGTWGPWHERLPHFRLGFTPSAGAELQTEYLLPRSQAAAGLAGLEGIAADMAPLLMVCEVRTMRADDQWLSGAYGRDTVAFHFTWRPTERVWSVLPELERILGGLGGRPHWGKIHAADPASLNARYPRWPDFAALRARLDPRNAFVTPFTAGLGLLTLEA